MSERPVCRRQARAISRREALQLLGGALVAGAAGSFACAARGPFDVVFVAIDDLNDWISPLSGFAGLATPQFERLAQRTTTFANAHAQGPSCITSRSSLMTGLYPETTGIVGEEQSDSHDFRKWAPDALTIPGHFRSAGYRALGFGKVFHGPDRGSWDEDQPRWPDPAPSHTPLNGISFPYFFDWGPLDLPASFMGDHRMLQAALAKLDGPRTGPTFFGLGISKPHLPWYLPREFFALHPLDRIAVSRQIPGDLDDLPRGASVEMPFGTAYHEWLEHFGAVRKALQGYLAAVSFVDSLIGMLVDDLDRRRAWDDTVVVVWSDHGQHLGEKKRWHKFTLWEESTHVPLFVHVPGVGDAGARCDRAVGLIDLFPTLIEACGLAPNDAVEGESLMPLLRDPGAPREHPARTTWGHAHALRTDRWRYIRYGDGGEELYDHESDPDETTNLAADPRFAEVRAGLAAQLGAT